MDPEEITYEQLASDSEDNPDLIDKIRQLDEDKRLRRAEQEERVKQGRHFLETLQAQSD